VPVSCKGIKLNTHTIFNESNGLGIFDKIAGEGTQIFSYI